MAQLSPSQYIRLTAPKTYGQSDGLYYDKTNVQLVMVIADTIVGKLPLTQTSGHVMTSDGTDTEPAALAAANIPTGTVARSKLVQEALVAFPVDPTRLRVWDAMQTNLPATAANDDMGLITGTLGTDAPTLQGVDFGGTSTDEMGAFLFRLPAEYDAGETITLRLRCGMVTGVSDGTATVDAQVYKCDRDGAVGADICATAAQSINSLTYANKDFTITPTGLAPGDLLMVRLAFGGSDVGNLVVMIPEISQIEFLLDVKG